MDYYDIINKEIIKNIKENCNDLEHLVIIYQLLKELSEQLGYELVSDKDKNNYNKLISCELIIKEVIEDIK